MNIAELALKNQEVGEHVSYIFEGQEITNMQMDRVAKKLGNALKKLGVKRGDRVIMQMQNCPEVLQAFQAIWKIGAIAIPINYLVGQEEINFIYKDSGANTIITSPEHLDKVKIAQSKVSGVKSIIMVSDKEHPGTHSFKKLVEENSDKLKIVATADDDVAALIYTSGTTGTPKGVMLTHYGLYDQPSAGSGYDCRSAALPFFRGRHDERRLPPLSRQGRHYAAVQSRTSFLQHPEI